MFLTVPMLGITQYRSEGARTAAASEAWLILLWRRDQTLDEGIPAYVGGDALRGLELLLALRVGRLF
jgi:hypothetical protein